MNNSELTLDQLSEVNGCFSFARYTLSMHQGAMNSLSRRGLNVGPIGRRGLSVGPIGRNWSKFNFSKVYAIKNIFLGFRYAVF